MKVNPLSSLDEYSRLLAELANRPKINHSNLVVWSSSPYTGIAEGEIFFSGNFRLRIREELDFAACLITSYGYEVYKREERIFWYDDFPHPQDSTLSSTFPHHKHIPPFINRNRIPAPEISFIRPNLPIIINEIEEIIEKTI